MTRSVPSRATVQWHVLRSVYAFELGIQRREPATILYALVFLLLTFAFVSSGTVELVRDRGALSKLSPLAISLAMGGLNAFGQVITTMIAASAMLRDAAWRTDQLVYATPADYRTWVIGRWLAACTVMLVVYSALMGGVLLGAVSPWVDRDVAMGTVALRALWPWVSITVPTTLAVATMLTAVAVRTQRLLAVLAAALTLLFLWQGCEAVWQAHATRQDAARAHVMDPSVLETNAQHESASSLFVRAAALLDPFGTVSVQVVSATWSDAQRNSQLVPWRGLVGASRVVWLALAGAIGVLALRRRPTFARTANVTRGEDTAAPLTSAALAPTSARRAVHVARDTSATPSHARSARLSTLRSLTGFTVTWLWRDRGWRVIAGLGVLNVLAHAITSSESLGGGASAVVALAQEHARLFLILLATIYAGELLWRDHDERVVELVHSAPIPTSWLVVSRVLGIAAAQLVMVTGLLAAAWAGSAVHGDVTRPWSVAGIGVLWLFVPFVQWTLLSLCVHVLVQHKVIAHLLLIAGWVLAVALDANGVSSPWIRFADPPSLVPGTPLPLADALWRAAWWSAVSAALLTLTVQRWRRVTSRR